MLPDSLTTESLVAQTNDCTLTVTVALDIVAEKLHLYYQVRNTSALPLYLLNQFWEKAWDDTTSNKEVFGVLPNLANVESSADAVTVSKKVTGVPYGFLVERLLVPLMTRLAPGNEFAETVVLALPLQLENIYQSGPLKVPAVPRPLYFELGYLSLEPAVEAIVREVATPAGMAFSMNAFPASEQSVIGVGPFQQPFMVLADPRPAPPPSNGEWTPWS